MSFNHKIATYMGDTLNLDRDNREVIAYSLELLFHTFITVLLVLLIAWLVGTFKEAVVLILVMFVFKNFAGGAHCSSAGRCTILSILLIPSFAQLSYVAGQYLTTNILIALTFFGFLYSFVMVYKFAPINLPIVSIQHKQKRRKLSFLLLMMIMLMQTILIILTPEKTASYVVAINISISWQAFILTKQGHALVKFYDDFLLFFVRKGGEKSETHETRRSF
jgi:accessory gene regulator B